MTDAQWEAGLALKLNGARRLSIEAWTALKTAQGAVVLFRATLPSFQYAAVNAINAAVVALAKAFSDRGTADCVQANMRRPVG